MTALSWCYVPMVDIHSHILWGLDDGARSFEQSLEMVRIALESGTTDIIAAPHLNAQYTFETGLMEEKIAQLRAGGANTPTIHAGCDLFLSFENAGHVLQDPAKYTIARGQYLLVECSNSDAGPETETVLARLLAAGLVPIVSHPERNPILRNDIARLTAWVDLGCRMQLTAMSITGGFGRAARSSALRILHCGLAHFVASEAHDPVRRSPSMTEAFDQVANLFGDGEARTLFVINPMNAVRGIPIDSASVHMPETTRKQWHLWRSHGVSE
jgi:protein-tyrosine phosphatase